MDKSTSTIHSHLIEVQHEELELSYNSMNSSEYSGYARVAFKACADVRRKDYLRRVCESDSEFKHMWRLECRKKEEKLKAMKEGVWKSRLDSVSCVEEPPKYTTIKKGRFLITFACNNEKKEVHRPTVTRKGRFLITKLFVKKEQKKPIVIKPTVTKKGRFVITCY
jgi:hypothetical protein